MKVPSLHTLKSVFVSPPLKEPTLYKDNTDNYQPVSILSFLSLILEEVAASHLNSHIDSSNTSNHYQSVTSFDGTKDYHDRD